jgi:copper transport protein
VVLAVAFAALAASPAAFAHAILLSSDPGNDAVVKRTPGKIILRFNEPVETAFGSIRIYDGGAKRVDNGKVSRPAPKEVSMPIAGELAQGTYTVTWRVVSADSHPVSGAFVFHVGKPGAKAGGIAAEVLGGGTPRSVEIAGATARTLRFMLLLLVAGGLAMLPTALVTAADAVKRRLARGIVAAAAGLVLVSLAGIGLQGADAGAFGLSKALDHSIFRSTLDTRFGKIWLLQAGIAAVVVLFASAASRQPARLAQRPVQAVGLLLGLALVCLPALSGHANVSGNLSLAADIVHVAAAAAWTGGLAFVIAALVLAGKERWPLASRAVPRFSLIAVVAVGALLAGGVTNGYLQVRRWDGLWETKYGVLLLVKAGLVLPVLALGAYNNRYAVPRLKAQIASLAEQRRFLRAAAVELSVIVAVVAITAVLVQEPPAKAFVAPTGPYATTTDLGPISLNFVVDPAKTGPNQVHLYLLDKNGRPTEVDEARVQARLPSKGIGPLTLRANRAGPGHYVVLGAAFPIAGDWQLSIEARRGDFDSFDKTLSVPIRKGP